MFIDETLIDNFTVLCNKINDDDIKDTFLSLFGLVINLDKTSEKAIDELKNNAQQIKEYDCAACGKCFNNGNKTSNTGKIPNIVSLNEFNVENHITTLEKWCNKRYGTIVFDSIIDGNGKGSLEKKVMNKSNLYFITFDDCGNAFGGFINTIINKTNDWILDPDCFVFSLLHNNLIHEKSYHLKGKDQRAIYMYSQEDYLYQFGCGADIFIYKTDVDKSFCNQMSFDYLNITNSFSKHDYPFTFSLSRLVVIQMN